jgi:calcineurin-like phosphoesterase family protein
MLNFLTISFLVFFVQGAEDTVKYVLENNYKKYVEMFSEVVGDKNTIDVSHYGTGKEIC